ncbi:Nif3-like dinuclear metal center hexameric protein [Flaviflexus ciconiae]|uniref:GTP cyclohydrolase 1 type 2 homolog n=1 Tax=Flaviflexus ciconiae TaxID=2496867 RepID=A0A3Q9G5T9_9ACTO|nr:Nif3-like dinuclear metal center hexameric protein [Flaviflexus ciconiae]AZQ76322.1 Nif3-like dinuclear metal center hexameric protein [Flaviflexus ciconiae]
MLTREIIAAVEELCPPALAESWDAVGLVAGSPDWEARRILLAVDPCEKTVSEAIDGGYDMLLTHHPLYLRGTSTVGAHTTKGAWITDLIRAGVSLYAAHTNADSWGTAQAMADLLGLENARPLIPKEDDPTLGLGRIGTIAPVMLGELADRVADLLPRTPAGILVGGDEERVVETVAVSPGSGDSFLGLVNDSGADVYITADLRHHPATDHLWGGGAALISPTHFASEWPLLPKLAGALREMLPGLEVDVSTVVTDAWVSRR